MKTATWTISSLFLILVAACAPKGPPPATVAAISAGTVPTASFTDQVAAGQQLFEEHCANCHGASGEGKKGPRLVGVAQGALPLEPPAGAKYRKNEFHTAADVATFVVKNMPPDAPGSLTEQEYWAILAFDLKANGIDLGTKHLDGTDAASVMIHP